MVLLLNVNLLSDTVKNILKVVSISMMVTFCIAFVGAVGYTAIFVETSIWFRILAVLGSFAAVMNTIGLSGCVADKLWVKPQYSRK